MRLIGRAAIGLALFMIGAVLALQLWARSAARPDSVGRPDGRLAPCPSSPNCVTTQSGLPEQRMQALPYRGGPEETRARLVDILGQRPRARIAREAPGYLHVEERSRLIGFIDDVEFVFDDAQGLVHFRSASRLGRGDLGVNRARMEEISRRYLE